MLSVADFDADGVSDAVDAAATTDDTGRFYVYGGALGGTIEAMPGATNPRYYPVYHWALSVATGDFDQDGRTDVAVGCGYANYGSGPSIVISGV